MPQAKPLSLNSRASRPRDALPDNSTEARNDHSFGETAGILFCSLIFRLESILGNSDDKGSMVKTSKLLLTIASVLSLTVSLSGCKGGSKTGSHSSSTGSSSSSQDNSDNPIRQCNTTSPGPYKEIEVDGADLMQTRYAQGQYGGTLKRSLVMADPKTFNYWAAADASSRELANLMYASLLDSDPYNGDIVPALAKSVSMDPDQVTYTVVLRKGLKWSDGHPITADDVTYTWNTIIKGGYGNSSLRDVTTVDGKSPEVTKVDDLTIKFKTAKPFAPFIRYIGMPIAPKHVVEPIISGKDGRKAFDGFWGVNTKPEDFVTNGPFTLESYVPGQRVVFKRSKNYYLLDESKKPLPYLDRLTYLIVQDVQTNLLKFKGKEIDMTIVRCRDAGDLVKEAKALDFKLYDFGPGYGSTFITFNMNPRKNAKGKPYVDPIKSVWFNDVNFRQAINHALDRKNIVNNYFKGLGAPAFMAEVKGAPFTNSELKPFEKNVEEAKALLKKSGFTWDKDGNLLDKAGNKVEFDLLSTAGGTFYAFVGVSFKKDMEELGIKVNYSEINGNVLNDKVMQSLDWQAILFSLTGDPTEPNDSVNVYKSSGRLHLFDQRMPDEKGEITVTDARPWEKEIDELLEKGAQTFDKEERKKIYGRVQAIMYEQAPFVYTAAPKQIVGARNTLHNYDPTPLSQLGVGLHNLPEIWVK